MTYLTQEQRDFIHEADLMAEDGCCVTDITLFLKIIRLQNLVIAKAVEQRDCAYCLLLDVDSYDRPVFSDYQDLANQRLKDIMNPNYPEIPEGSNDEN